MATSDQRVIQTSGSYTANLLGNIRSHLAGLQGFDVMALELIQNADDARAEKIVFDITDQGLLVTNSGQFTYCGDLNKRPCKFVQNGDSYSCDYHRIVDVGSGGKLTHSENIGRFGIGFVSTYQVTDHPEIQSSGIKLTLQPESGQWFVESVEQATGTSFFLPWANNPNTEARLALGVSHISPSHINQLTEDIQKILRKSLLFLRYVQKAEVRKDGKLLLACDLDRGDGSDLTISFRPGGEIEQWYILRADAAEMAEELYENHPRLEALGRGTDISIGLRISPEPLTEGLLYAFLPTEQTTGLPLHINGDFFPESDRKAVIFAGHQHEQAWNEMLIDAAATEIARDPEALLQKLGHIQLWQILSRAYDLSKSQNHPSCYTSFWEQLKVTASQSQIVIAQDGSMQCPGGVFLPRTTLNALQVKAFQGVGGRVAVEELRSYQNAMGQLGAPVLTLERMVNLLAAVASPSQATEQDLENLYRPIWSMVNDLLPEAGAQNPANTQSIQKLSGIPFVVTEDFYVVTINQSYLTPLSLDAAKVASVLPTLAIASHHLLNYPKIARLIKPLELGVVANHLHMQCSSEKVEEVIGVERDELRELYKLFSELDKFGNTAITVYQILRKLPIWLSSRGLICADNALLPGDYNDPTGQADLLDVSIMSESVRDFVSLKLGLETQTIEAFVLNVLPNFFSDDGPRDVHKYSQLILDLANHPSLVNDDSIRRLLGTLPIIPTQDENWSCPIKTYRRTEGLVKILGEAPHLWLDSSRIPNTRSVHSFIDSLGIRRTPIAQHLVERMLYIAEKFMPTEDAKRASGEAFYVLCDNYEEWKDKKSFGNAIEDLQAAECFPAEGDNEQWHSADSLYAPYRSEAFSSQAHILDFRNTVRLKTDLLEELDITINPETELVVKHLLYCVERGVQPHVTTYQILNERAQKSDPLIARLSGSRCIYVESQKIFVRPNQIYWMPQQLGRYAFTIPGNFETFKSLFTALGVKNAPEASDYVDLLLDIVGEHFEQAKSVTGKDRAVYDACLSGIADADDLEELELSDLQRLQEAPTILNLKNQLIHPDELFLQDSEWHVGFFNGELDSALCKPVTELWPLIEKIGVKRLSDCAEVALEFVDGEMRSEELVAEKLVERSDIFSRLLHDKPSVSRTRIRRALAEVAAISYDTVRIQAEVNLGGNNVTAPPTPTHAFFDIEDCKLILARPIVDRSWSHILNALFHQLMPEETSSEISKLTLSVRPLMTMPVAEAHRELTDAGIPFLDAENVDAIDDLTSPQLDDMGAVTDPEEGQAAATSSKSHEENHGEETFTHKQQNEAQPTDKQDREIDATHDESPKSNPGGVTGSAEPASGNQTPEAGPAKSPFGEPAGKRDQDPSPDKKPQTKKRSKHKEHWDRRLLSYVRKMAEEFDESSEGSSISEHNLAVEAVARNAVCLYEKRRGRVAVQMPQTHPGYDIISHNPLTGEERYIEVKGINGEWNKTGVGLSKLQFSNAQDLGDSYWLYAVEYVSDLKNMRVHPICSPATQVTAFMFDGNWREAISEEPADPSLAFIEGARVKHQHYGLGNIESMTLKGSSRVMAIKFDQGGKRTVSLNLQVMEVLEDEYGDDAS